jgi:hypothetical protein
MDLGITPRETEALNWDHSDAGCPGGNQKLHGRSVRVRNNEEMIGLCSRLHLGPRCDRVNLNLMSSLLCSQQAITVLKGSTRPTEAGPHCASLS